MFKFLKPFERFFIKSISEGAAFGAGIAKYLIEQGQKFETIVHLSADEGDEFSTPKEPTTYQLGYNGDWVTGNKEIKGTDKSGIVKKFDNFLDKMQYSHGSTKGAGVFKEVRALMNLVIEGSSAVNVTETSSGTTFTFFRDNVKKRKNNEEGDFN